MAIIDSLLWAAALGLTAYGIVQIPPSGIRETLTYVLIALVAFSLYVAHLFDCLIADEKIGYSVSLFCI